MSSTMVIGLLVVGLSAAGLYLLLFGRTPEPATDHGAASGHPQRRLSIPRRPPDPRGSIQPKPSERLRAASGLILLTLGIGLGVAAVVGVVVLVAGLAIQ